MASWETHRLKRSEANKRTQETLDEFAKEVGVDAPVLQPVLRENINETTMFQAQREEAIVNFFIQVLKKLSSQKGKTK